MDCDTSDQWSGIELLRVFFLTLTFFQQNFQALIGLDKWACPSKTNMPSPITQPPFQLEVAGKSLTLKCLKPQ